MNLNFIRSLVLLVTLFLLSAMSFANTQTATASEFRKSIEEAQGLCPSLKCPQSVVTLKQLDPASWTALPTTTQKFLNAQAVERSVAWDDTILESDYFTSDKDSVSLNSVAFVDRNNQRIGYRIIFAIRAWDTSTCPFDPENPKLEGCQEGLIIDAAFVSLDLKEVFQDETSYAHFVAASPTYYAVTDPLNCP